MNKKVLFAILAVGVIILLLTKSKLLNGPGDAPKMTKTDILVIGAGISGLSAALEAAPSGAQITIVDMWSIFGGHAVSSHGGLSIIGSPEQEAQNIKDSEDLAYKDFVKFGEDPNEDWTKYYISHSRSEIYDWLTPLGVEISKVLFLPGNSVPRMHIVKNLGVGLVTPIFREIQKYPNVKFQFNTKITELIKKDGMIVGAKGKNIRKNRQHRFLAKQTIVATGGFQSNLDRVIENWREDLPKPKNILAGSGPRSQGNGLDFVSKVGGDLSRLDHQWNYTNGILDPRHKDKNRGLSVMNHGSIWLNLDGQRFVNECLSAKHTLPEVLKQKDHVYWMIFDADRKEKTFVSGSGWTRERINRIVFGDSQTVISAATLEELSKKIGLDSSKVVASVNRYNSLLEQGEDKDFKRFGKKYEIKWSGCTRPPKVKKGPFYAMKMHILSRKSMGGIVINTKAEVLDKQSQVIDGLYAVGEASGLAGINGKHGLEGTFLGPSIITGRVAARTAVAKLDSLKEPTRINTDDLFRVDPKTENSTCLNCHNLDKELKEEKWGYTHFKYVHTEVKSSNLQCVSCHKSVNPTDLKQHSFNYTELSKACYTCHGVE